MKIYKGQTAVRLILDTNLDLSVYVPNSAKINFKKPSGEIGYFTAAVDSESNTKIYVEFDESKNFDEYGNWELWAELAFGDDRTGVGEVKTYFVDSSPVAS